MAGDHSKGLLNAGIYEALYVEQARRRAHPTWLETTGYLCGRYGASRMEGKRPRSLRASAHISSSPVRTHLHTHICQVLLLQSDTSIRHLRQFPGEEAATKPAPTFCLCPRARTHTHTHTMSSSLAARRIACEYQDIERKRPRSLRTLYRHRKLHTHTFNLHHITPHIQHSTSMPANSPADSPAGYALLH